MWTMQIHANGTIRMNPIKHFIKIDNTSKDRNPFEEVLRDIDKQEQYKTLQKTCKHNQKLTNSTGTTICARCGKVL